MLPHVSVPILPLRADGRVIRAPSRGGHRCRGEPLRANAANPCALVLCLALAAGSAGPLLSAAQEPQPPLPGAASSLPREGTYLYRFHLVQAAPGKLLDLIELLGRHASAIAAGGDEAPFIVRHSQGDHWDLAVVHPLKSWQEYVSPGRTSKRIAGAEAAGLSEAELARRLDETVAWQEDLYVLDRKSVV